MNKTILIITQNIKHYDLYMTCVENSTYPLKIVGSFKYRLNDIVHERDDLVKKISLDLENIEYDHHPILVSLNLYDLFLETIQIPKISLMESKKAIQLEMAKLYGDDYENKYYFVENFAPLSKSVNEYRFLLILKEKYADLLTFIKHLKPPLEKICLHSDLLVDLTVDKEKIKKDETHILINITSDYTYVVLFTGWKLLSFRTLFLGTSMLDDVIAERQKVGKRIAKNERISGRVENLKGIIISIFQELFTVIKMMSYSSEHLGTILVNSEDGSSKEFVEVLAKRYRTKIVDFMAQDRFLANNYNVFTTLAKDNKSPKYSFTLPEKVK